MASWTKVKSFARGSYLDFVSRKSGDTLLRLDAENDQVIIPAGAQLYAPSGIVRTTTRTDLDAQNGTITAAAIAGGLLVHTSVTGGGTLTFDTAANIIAAIPLLATLGARWEFGIVNDGDQTVTLANDAGPSVTISDTGQTIAINESCIVWLVNTGAGALAAHVFGA